MIKQREYGIDLLKIMACIGIVALHTVNGTLGIFNRIITLICTLCIPIFFVCSGYLMFLKKEISYSYVIKKIVKILLVCFAWEALHAIAYFLYYHQIRNFIESFFRDFLQEGLFFHFWFMGTLIILYMLLPMLRILELKKTKVYLGALGLLGLLCVGIDVLSIFVGRQIQLQVIQTFRLWTWLFYYMIGGFIATHSDKLCQYIPKHKEICVVCILFFIIAWQWIIGFGRFNEIRIEAFYGSLPVLLGTSLIFCCLYKVKMANGFICIVSKLSPLVMGIYIVHPFILAMIVHFAPTLGINPIFNLIYWLLTVILSAIITWIISKIPFICELIRV